MSHTITPGQTYRACAPYPYGPTRIRITAYEPGAATADAADRDSGAPCVVLAADLHASPAHDDGTPRTEGYALTRTLIALAAPQERP
ncbi:hypothetical protein [Streptomyces sp. MH60]|uniref:hypothetical protein n=1 Tax=Streptomyces sp. MH60 TaxID=1940758 RepID=UPI000CEDFA89|nr:hypothetical protein [Streptomyces sp. MH60]PPS89408.1 hypothetical protein BZZ08_01554 [Streptomyces sp. MH60]